jgi:putative ABC transport system substrate-binding protein
MRRRELIAVLSGATIAWPLAARAQQKPMPVIGFLHASSPIGQSQSYIASFLEGLMEQGFEQGRDVAVEYRWAEGHYERVPLLAAELLRLNPTMIVIYGPPNVLRAGIDTLPRALPIVFGTGGDPVAAGIVPSLARPGGNATGVANRTNSLDVKRLELLCDLVPSASLIAMLFNPKNSDSPEVTKAAQAGAHTLGRQLVLAGASSIDELDEGFARVAQQRVGALLMGSDTFLNAQQDRIVALAARYRLPTIYPGREYAKIGGLISYGASFSDNYRLMGVYAGKILHGAKPADLPVVEPTRFQLVINLNTAKALGITVPQLLLAQADEVIE